MLSYQHLYHAGNLADVHKHALLAVMLDYLTAKDKPLSYIETHAGRGLYALDAPEALKTGEAAEGIARVERLGWFAPAHPYARALAATRAAHGAAAYPGSPLLAATLLRPVDSIRLAELHPREFAALRTAMAAHGGIFQQIDGLQMALSITPPTPRRGILLIDPSYEVKADYEALPPFLASVARKWNVGVIALWYPILASGPHQPMLAALSANHPEALRHEVRFAPARAAHGMVGSGMFIVNAPWGIGAEARRLTGLFSALGGT
ncbi:23S rRNA (adenine(2030)-N(6))-methyltransferase RlmJ [Phaeovulum sp.]|uniref:23S rRNA (adenine(2030)-N(6))-methyltransferase RlmJ n=1 Tax=Phaeovulum sp. TaxID=2934796 RepID=UPI00273055B3|nr:23S rRNA (adenine(2030)-N(6))-methyltransferase RlmJ [Phaeovulum sp.]MDP1668453.1 23S rRNA (adenine(2030)-N(6))-methyltransferase RlmJ [Phaeovulum sp.]MDZ4118896.1 23S rRNA (adenine(2030)-N(6))-methyltransferase RlmJ [Phaeovulum sp.]